MASAQHPASPIVASKTQRPRHLNAAHWAELVDGSAITPALAAANFRTFGAAPFVDPERERQVLLAVKLAEGNQQPGHSYQRRMKLQWQYGHLDGGGWRFLGDALPGFASTPRWKPDQPRISSKGRPIKYEAQPGRRPGLLLAQVPVTVWRLIAERHGLALPADRSAGFWAWALATPDLPITIVEGEKKACALLGLGVVAVGLGGKDLGRMVLARDAKNRACDEALVPELEALAAGGRHLTICFDADPKPKTASDVLWAATRLGHLLEQAKAVVRVVRLPLLEGAKCGPDDLLVALGAAALLEALANGLALAELAWERRYWAERRIRPTRAGLRPSELAGALQQATAKVVGVRAPKGAGKTLALEQVLADVPQVLAITHRRSLGASMASRLGLVWRNDTDTALGCTLLADGEVVEGLPPRYALCIDSLLAVRPDQFLGAVLVLDEAEQLLAHLLTSSTCRQQRGLLIQRLQRICACASQVVALDADLSDATLQWLQKAAGGEVDLLVGSGPQQAWPVSWYEQSRPEALQAALMEAAAAGPVWVTCDSRERAAALHDLLQHHLPQANGLLVTSATTDQPEVQAWLGKLTSIEALAAGGLRWVVSSPSISSGLSIEHGYFRSVWGLFGAGSFDDGEALQALARIRQPVPRHVWVAPAVRPALKPLSSAWWPSQVERDLLQRWNSQAALLRQQLQPDLLMAPSPIEAAEQAQQAAALWADLQSRRNYALHHLRPFIKARLRAEGHTILPTVDELAAHDAAALRALNKGLRSDRHQAHAEAVANAPIISKAQAEVLYRQQQHSPALQRRILVERLALEPEALTPELVMWGNKWASAAERLARLLEPAMAAQLDLQRLQATTPKGQAPLPFDQTYKAQHYKAAELIGLKAFVEQFPLRSRFWDQTTPEVVELAKQARHYQVDLQKALGLTIKANDTDTALVGALLAGFGITTSAKRAGSTSRIYGADGDQLALIRSTAERLRRKHFRQAPPIADLGRFANKPLEVEQGLDTDQHHAAPCLQLPLAIATNGHHPAQHSGGGGASSEAPPGRHRPPLHPWGTGGAGHRPAPSRP